MSRSLNLLFAATVFPKTSETFVTDQIIGLHRLGHRIDVFSPHGGAIEDPVLCRDLAGAVRHLFLPPGTPIDPALAWLPQRRLPAWYQPRTWGRLFRVVTHPGFRRLRYPLKRGAALLQGPPYDAVVCHFGPAGVMMQQMRDIGLITAPLVTVFHGYDVTNYLERVPDGFYDELFDRGDRFLPISDRWRNRLLELGCPPERIRLQRLGTNLDTFAHAVRSPGPGQTLRLMSVARLVEKKGVEYGIRAVARLVAAGVDVTYDVIGDGPLREDLEHLVRERNLTGRVNFLGARPHAEIATLMREHHILLVPSVTDAAGGMEGIPVVIMEAMATGLLVVASRHSGIPEIVHHEETGLLATERDDADLAACLDGIRRDEARWKSLVLAARDTVHEEYDLQRQNARLAEILAEISS